MKGPKIENIRDPKWVGKHITSDFKTIKYFELKGIGTSFLYGINFGSVNLDGWDSWPIKYPWYEWIEEEPKFPFKVGDIIRCTQFSDATYLEIKVIEEDNISVLWFRNGVKSLEGVSREYALFDEIMRYPTYWELYTPPKKKKTVAFALMKNSLDSFYLTDLAYPYDSRNAESIKQHPDLIQFPAVTKDGTVLEFEVDDE